MTPSASIGKLTWIGLRPGRRQPMDTMDSATCELEGGLQGDCYDEAGGHRQVTIIQWEHLAEIAERLGVPEVRPEQLRRNLAVSGCDVSQWERAEFQIGAVRLQGTGPCRPCARMNDTLGPGGLAAMEGRGGITARVVHGGLIRARRRGDCGSAGER